MTLRISKLLLLCFFFLVSANVPAQTRTIYNTGTRTYNTQSWQQQQRRVQSYRQAQERKYYQQMNQPQIVICYDLEGYGEQLSVRGVSSHYGSSAAYRDTSGKNYVTIYPGVDSNGKWCESSCHSIVTNIKSFMDCEWLTGINIPNTVKTISRFAFRNCKNLSSISLPNSVKTIGENVFDGCSSLATIYIGDGLENIGERAFAGCIRLREINVSTSNKNFASEDGVLYDKLQQKLIKYPSARKATTYTIPNTVKVICNDAFQNCPYLTSIIIPSCEEILKWDFGSNGNFRDIFNGCKNLKELYVPQGRNLNITTLPSGVNIVYYNPQNEINPSEPPLLALVNESIEFSDATKNNRIDANEQSTLRFKIINRGKGAANNVEIRTHLSGSTSGVSVNTLKLPTIAPGQEYEVKLPVTSNLNTQDGELVMSIEVFEPHGFGVSPFKMTVQTKAYEAPYLQIVDYNIASNSGKIKKMEPFTLTFSLQNTKYGNGEDVNVKINLPRNVFVMDGKDKVSFPLIKSGEAKQVTIQLVANNNYEDKNIPVQIIVKERHGRFAESKHLDFALNQATSSNITIAAKEEPRVEHKEIQLASLTSEIDRNIPATGKKNENTFVVIIANEQYQQVASVPYAMNDGIIFQKYCEQTLGIPSKHIHTQTNATGNQIKSHVNWLRNVVEVFESPNIIFYYAGHGIPDESSKSAYLLPIDGMINDLTTCYKLDDLYSTLGDMPASHIMVFIDACFSGSKREEGMLASARAVALNSRPGQPKGNMIVFSAAQGNETAYPYDKHRHGMFTYYLLKKLQESKGNVTMSELRDYIVKNVTQQSVVENNKMQTPSVTPAPVVKNTWESWKL